MSGDYNLLDSPWIPILYDNGRARREGISAVLKHAHRIRDIAASNPMDRFAVLRFLLAVLYWCKGNPTEGDKEVTQFPADWFAKLEEHRECFNLLGEGRRFYQSAGNQRPRPTTDLIHELPTANNPWHFKHLTDGEEGLCPNCCALGLLRLPLFTTLGGAGGKISPYFFAGINGAPPIYTLTQGASLCETLRKNWKEAGMELGSPNWDSNGAESTEQGTSLLAGLTHLPRRVWLGELEDGLCVLCGSSAGRIRECNIVSSGKYEDENWIDPHALFRLDKDELKPVRSWDPTQSEFVMNNQWSRIHAASNETVGAPRWLVAFTSADASKVDVTESIVRTASSDKANLEEWRKGVRLPARAETKKRAITTTFRPHVEHIVSQNAQMLLQDGEEGWNKAAREYEEPLKAAARSLAPDYTAEALLRRSEIERAVPKWTEPKPEGEKPKRTRGKKK